MGLVGEQCELLEAQKVAAEESFAQLRQTLEKEIVDARTRCLELERLRFAPVRSHFSHFRASLCVVRRIVRRIVCRVSCVVCRASRVVLIG
jgi:hypothetical protein